MTLPARSRRVPFSLFLFMVTALAAARAADPKGEGAWRPLFDGKSTSGWRGFKKEGPPESWKVEQGCLTATAGDGQHHGEDLVTADTFTDFELRFTWRRPPRGNSGVKYLVTEERSGPTAHEYQLIDDAAHADAQRGGKRTTAAFYDVLPPSGEKTLRPSGELNESRLLVRGSHVEHWLNGAKVVEYELGSQVLREAIAQSKFKDVAGFGEKIPGRILLQNHGDAVAFCTVEIRELSN